MPYFVRVNSLVSSPALTRAAGCPDAETAVMVAAGLAQAPASRRRRRAAAAAA